MPWQGLVGRTSRAGVHPLCAVAPEHSDPVHLEGAGNRAARRPVVRAARRCRVRARPPPADWRPLRQLDPQFRAALVQRHQLVPGPLASGLAEIGLPFLTACPARTNPGLRPERPRFSAGLSPRQMPRELVLRIRWRDVIAVPRSRKACALDPRAMQMRLVGLIGHRPPHRLNDAAPAPIRCRHGRGGPDHQRTALQYPLGARFSSPGSLRLRGSERRGSPASVSATRLLHVNHQLLQLGPDPPPSQNQRRDVAKDGSFEPSDSRGFGTRNASSPSAANAAKVRKSGQTERIGPRSVPPGIGTGGRITEGAFTERQASYLDVLSRDLHCRG